MRLLKTKKVFCSVVVPCYNESENVQMFYQRTSKVLDSLDKSWEIIAVNDGSKDDTLEKLLELHHKDNRLKVINLSRNFGKEIALTAGLDHSNGDVTIPIDADLQDPPEFIPELVKKWEEGFDVVYAVRSSRKGESFLKKITSFVFYRIMARFTKFELPRDTGDFRLMDRNVIEKLKEVREYHRFMKGLFTWVGFKQIGVQYDRDPRYAGKTKWNYWKLFNFAIEGITSFSTFPLRIASYLGFLIATLSSILGVVLLVRYITFDSITPGYTSTIVVTLFLGGIQLFFLGVLGEYIGRIFNETKGRPLYIVRDFYE